MFNQQLKPRHIIAIIFLFYIPSAIQGATYWFNFVDHDTIYPTVQRLFPEYNITVEVGDGLLTGIINLLSPSAVYALSHMTMPVTPIYIGIFYFRKSIIRILMRSHGSMSKETKSVHSQLLKALTCQAIIPVAVWLAVYIYIAMQFGLVRGRLFEYMTFFFVVFMPILSPITYLYFVRPYRLFIVRLLCGKWPKTQRVKEENRTRFYSEYSMNTASTVPRRF